jgi:hypothetical protein
MNQPEYCCCGISHILLRNTAIQYIYIYMEHLLSAALSETVGTHPSSFAMWQAVGEAAAAVETSAAVAQDKGMKVSGLALIRDVPLLTLSLSSLTRNRID